MIGNGILEHYRSYISNQGQVDIESLPMVSGTEHCFGKDVQTLTDENNRKFYFKKCTDREQTAEVLLSQIYAKAGFNSAIYLPAGPNKVVSNDIGRNGEIAGLFFFRKVIEERAKTDPISAKSMAATNRIDPRHLGICWTNRYTRFMTPECAKDYFEMRGFDVAAKNTDRHLANYFFEPNENDLASKINLFDYGYSAINYSKPDFLELSYCSLIGGQTSSKMDFLLKQLVHDDDIAKYMSSEKLAEKIGAVDVVGTAKDIEQTIGFKCDQDYVDDIARSFDITARELTLI